MRGGVAGEFHTADALVAAVRDLRARGYDTLDAFTPFPVGALDDALGLRRPRQNQIAFAVSMAGAAAAFALQWFCNAWDYPLDTGGRPPFAAPAFVPITFETAVLSAAAAALLSLFALTGLPHLSHPLFGVRGFERASIDRFWVAVDARDARFDDVRTVDDLTAVGAVRVARFGDLPPRVGGQP